MKTFTIKRMLIVIAALFTISQSANAQNYAKEVSFQNSNIQIVRVLNENERVVYTEDAAHNDREFIFYTDASSVVGAVYLSEYEGFEYFVRDFVIFDGDIYVCGYKKDLTTGDSTGIFGKLNPANAYMISYCDVPGTTIMRKLVVFADSQKPHLVLIGDENSKTSIIVDVRLSSPNNWFITYSGISPIEKNKYLDLTVTDHCVVVVGRTRTGSHPINIHVFNRPTTYQSIFFIQAQMLTTEFNANATIFVEHRSGDEYAVVASMSPLLGYYFSVYNNVSHIATTSFFYSSSRLFDMRHNQSTGKTDVLLRHIKNNVVQYEIVHHSASSLAYISSHNTLDYAITSLDYLGGSGDMVAAGFSSSNGYLQIYKYQPSVFRCFNEKHPMGTSVSNNIVMKEEKFDGVFYMREFITVENEIKGHKITTLCE